MANELQQTLQKYRQEHLLAYWSQLNSAEQERLQSQIESIDWLEFTQLRENHCQRVVHSPADAAISTESMQPPHAVRLGEEPAGFTREQARECGAAALRAGKIGMILVAGGLGTRLGFDLPKGMYPLGPISNRTLFQILIDRLRAVARYYGVSIPLYVMTSTATHTHTTEYMRETRNCGLREDELRLFQQGAMYAVDSTSFEILLSSPGELFMGPDGHGGMLKALFRSGCLTEAVNRGVEQFFYGQIDNPLLTVCDPEFMGCHLLSGSELTTQAVAKVDPTEKVGVLVEVAGSTQIIEYVDLPDAIQHERLSNGSLKYWAGNTAVHAFQAEFLQRMAASNTALPLHVSQKKVPYLDRSGKFVEPTTPNALRFERFIFDLLPLANKPLVVEVSPAAAFAPVKNDDSAPTDSPLTARTAMLNQARELLTAAGATLAAGTRVEVNPLWAYNAAEAGEKLPPNTTVTTDTYFT